jgi:WD40 repeat protein
MCCDTLQVWDTASGQLKLTLTGHIEQVSVRCHANPWEFSHNPAPFKPILNMPYQSGTRHPHSTGMKQCRNPSPTARAASTIVRSSDRLMWRNPASPQVTGIAVSDRHPYMFSGSLDKEVKCWDLEYNKARQVTPARRYFTADLCLAIMKPAIAASYSPLPLRVCLCACASLG